MPTHKLHPDELRGTSTTMPRRSGADTTSLLLIDPQHPHALIARANRRWVRMVVSLLGSTLDAQLAQGRPPESNRFLAARAQILVSPAGRRALAQDWANLMERAGEPPPPRSPRVSLNRSAIVRSEGKIREMLALLARPLPISARGAAAASMLLSDGTGPLYRHHGPSDLGRSLTEVMPRLDPSSSLQPSP